MNQLTMCARADGADHFMTGAGGFIQSVTHGYGGLRYTPDGMRLWPRALPGSRATTFRGLRYLQSALTVNVALGGSGSLCLLRQGPDDKPLQVRVANQTAPATALQPGRCLQFAAADAPMLVSR